MDLERIKKRNALFDRGGKLIEQARKLDVEDNYLEALPVYTEAIETLFQTLQYVSNAEDKRQLRTLIEQFLSRAEEIKAIFAQQQELLQFYQQRPGSADLTQSMQQLRLSESASASNNSTSNNTYSRASDVTSAVQQLEAIHVPAEPPKQVLGRLARTSVALPGLNQAQSQAQSMTPVQMGSDSAQNMTASNGAQFGQSTQSSPYSPAPQHNNNGYTSNTNPWASAITSPAAQPSPNHYASPYQPNMTASYTAPSSPYNNATYTNNTYTSPYSNSNGSNNYTNSNQPSPNHYASPYQPNMAASYTAPSSPYTAATHTYSSPRASQHYPAPGTGTYSPYNTAPYGTNPSSYPSPVAVDQYGRAYPQPYPAPYSEVLPQPLYPQLYPSAAQPYSPHTAQSYYEHTSPRQSYAAPHSTYQSDPRYNTQSSNPWGSYASSACEPCDPCAVNYQCTQGLPPMSGTVAQVQPRPGMASSVAQSWPQQYATQFTDLNQFINTNNLAAAVPQPDRDREKIILYFVSKGFQRQHVESSYDYLRKMNLQVNADFVEILKDALLVYPTTGTGTAAGGTTGTPVSAVPPTVPNNLLGEVNTLPRPQWVSDDKAPQCKICAAPFTVLFRRHHCRGCGNVVCALCSDKEVPLPKLGYIHPVRVCKTCYENRELVELKTTGDTSTVKVAAATFTKSVSDSLSKGTDFLYTQFFSAVARSTALSPAEITEIARATKLSESEVSAHHLTFQEHKSPGSGDYELHNYRYVLGPFGYSQPPSGPDVVEWLYATLHHSFYQGTSTEPKGVPFADYIATMGTLLRGTEEARARLGYTTLYLADQLSQTPLDARRLAAPSYVLDKRKYLRRETARLPQCVPLSEMRVSVDHVTAVLFGVVEWLRGLKVNMDRRHARIDAALALLQPYAALTCASYLRDNLAAKLVHALLHGQARAPERKLKPPSGHVVFPGHPHFNVMVSLMFAMQLAVDSAENNRPIVSSDFSEKRTDQTPCWPTTNPQLLGAEVSEPVMPTTFYSVKIYTPTVWRAIRNKFGISETDLLGSIGLEGVIWPWLFAGEWRGWSQQGSYGKSGSMFFYSSDGQFLLKTISASEAESLREMLAKYYDHVTTGPTLLTPFLGLLRLKDNKGKEHHVLVMRTVFTTQQAISVSYDLKGSVAGRITAEKDRKPGAPMKDLDFDRVVELHPAQHQRLLSTLARDSKFLASQGVMDYSLLLGITHQPGVGARDVTTSDGGWPAASGGEVYYMGIIDYLVKFTALKLLESTFKSFKYARHEISALPPDEYAERFLAFMQSIFKIR